MEPRYLVIIAISLLFSALFSGVEIAFVSANKLHLEIISKNRSLVGRILAKFLQTPSKFIGTTLIGNTLALVIYGYYMARLLEPFILANLPVPLVGEASLMVVQTLISTLIVLFTAEFLPKSIFMINPERMLSGLAIPMRVISVLISPIVIVVVFLSKIFIKYVLRLEYSDDKPIFRLTDLDAFIQESTKLKSEGGNVHVDSKIFSNALGFKGTRVRECMVPRTEITSVAIDDDIVDLKEALIESGHSKILVHKEDLDNILGYCHTLELFKKPTSIAKILTPIIIVPESMLANELMIKFIEERKSLALVVDEFGGTSGIVSIEDIIEEIFGEIQDEHDEEDLVEVRIDRGKYRLSARLEIDYLNDKYGWSLPEGDYETLGGLLLTIAEDIPDLDDVLEIEGYDFQIESVENNRINTIKITVN